MDFTIFFDISLVILTVLGIALFHIPIVLWTGVSWKKVSDSDLLSTKVKTSIYYGLIVCSIFFELLNIPIIIRGLNYIYPFFYYEKPTSLMQFLITFIPLILNVALLFGCTIIIEKNTEIGYSKLANVFEQYEEEKVNLQNQLKNMNLNLEMSMLVNHKSKKINHLAATYNKNRKNVSSSTFPARLEYIEIVDNEIEGKS